MAAINESLGSNMEQSTTDFSQIRESLSVRHGQYAILAAILFFQVVNWIIKSQGPPKSLNDDEWKWRNVMVSWVHAIVASAWVLSATFFYPELYGDLLQHISPLTFYSVCFSTGYFVYDFLDLVRNNKFFSCWELSVHHISIAGMFYYNIHIKSQIAFSIVALSVEINSVFLHWRKLLQMVRTPYDSSKYILVKYLNLLTFVVFRGGPLIIISSGIFIWKNTVSIYYLIGISTTTFFMDVVNIILFWRLLKSDIFRGKQGSSSRASTKLVTSSESNFVSNKHILSGNNNCTDVKPRRSAVNKPENE